MAKAAVIIKKPAAATVAAKRPLLVSDLQQDPQNRRSHNDRNLAMVRDALREVGAARSIVIDEHNVILAGNGVTQAAAGAGITKVRVVDVEGDELVAVRRRGLTDDQKRALAIYDNRTGELATWNLEQLRADEAAGLALDAFWTTDERSILLAAPIDAMDTRDPDVVPARRKKTAVKAGDIYELGGHRLICGDATSADVVASVLGDVVPPLMVTDPPYGVNYDPTWRAAAGINQNTGKLGAVANDDRADWTEVWRHFPGSIAYVWHAGLKAHEVSASLELAGFSLRAQIVWAKDRMALSRGDYHWQHEPCWYAVRAGASGKRTKDRTQTTLWRVPVVAGEQPSADASTVWEIDAREDDGHGHGTQKPVECMARPMRNHLVREVFDPFCGSGTSLIAAERSGVRCFAIELLPEYVQLAIDRWEAWTKQSARQVRR
jgi:DNA modification methylase